MTQTDIDFAARFPGLNLNAFVNNNTTLPGFIPAQSPINLGMYDDIARATVYGYDRQDNFWSRFMKSPLERGDAEMGVRFSDVASRAYNPLAPDTELFNGQRVNMLSDVAKINLERQIYTEVNDRMLKRFVQTKEMIGDAIAAIQSASFNCYLDDMWTASKTYFSGSLRGSPAGSVAILTHNPGEDGFAEEMSELLFNTVENQFAYKSTLYNASACRTKANSVSIALKKSVDYPTFRKMFSDTYHPDLLKIPSTADYVDDFATPAGAPDGAGELLGIVADNRRWSITPLPDAIVTEAFRNPVRHSTSFATTYAYIFHDLPFFNIKWIFAPAASP